MSYWLLKSEGACYSIDDLKRDGVTAWTGIRNFQARNFMRDSMRPGDLALFYHSSSEPTGVFGVAEIVSQAHPDETAFDKRDEHYDPKSKRENPTWMCVDVKFVKKFKEPYTLDRMKANPHLANMRALQRGNRLSVTPVAKKEFEAICGADK